MNTRKQPYDLRSNVGKTDTLVRYVVGGALVASILAVTPLTLGWQLLLPLLGIPLVISAIIHWDPLYSLLKVNTIPAAKRRLAKRVELVRYLASDRKKDLLVKAAKLRELRT